MISINADAIFSLLEVLSEQGVISLKPPSLASKPLGDKSPDHPELHH
jgi:hypothetical protein